MSPTEAIMWAVEKDPALRSDFCNLTILDRSPDPDRLRAKVREAIGLIPRLGQRVVARPAHLGPPQWRPDPTFDLDYHLRRVAVPPPGGDRQLCDLAAALSAPPLDRGRPLWEFTVIDGLAGGGAAMLQRLHHTITDGVGGLRLSLSLVDLERDPPPGVDPPGGPAAGTGAGDDAPDGRETRDAPALAGDTDRPWSLALEGAAAALATLGRVPVQAAGTIGGLVRHPGELLEVPRTAWSLASSLRRQVLVTEDARSPLLTARSLGRRFDLLPVPLEPLRTAAHRLGGTVNDAFVAAVTSGLGTYHARLGAPVEALRMAMPVNLRHGEADREAGNRFAPTRILVPLGPKDPAAHFAAVRARLAEVRDEPVLGITEVLAGLVAGLPTSLLVEATRAQARTVDFAASNLRGSPVPLYLAGARIESSFPFGPRSGCALNVTVLSYCGTLDVGVHSDPAAVTDPDALVECLREAFDELTALGAEA
jgi:WS/DGAT/MGAT family acyltransferase